MMFIAHVFFSVAAVDRQRVLDWLAQDADAVRSMPGCIKFMPFADLTDPGQIGILHEWQSSERFADYTSNDIFKKFGTNIRPLVVVPPVSQRFEVKLIEQV